MPKDAFRKRRTGALALAMMGLFGAGLLYGDACITPAISVLGAVEGLGVAAPSLAQWILPITIAILVVLFLVQHHGTARIGNVFGWVMLIYFASIATAGIRGIVLYDPGVLRALSPVYAVEFFVDNYRTATPVYFLLGSVVLAITGGEALYADMGHFGRRPIRLAWTVVVLPCLLLSYFGQGAALLGGPPQVRENPFYFLAPGPAGYAMLVIATMAAIVASQALISGVYSLTQQAVQLGFWPRVRIVHTSGEQRGQIYIPEMNYLLMAATLALVVGFQSSTALAGAYGIATVITMTITSTLFFVLAFRQWKWPLWKAGSIFALFLAVDVAFLGANLAKVPHGGWLPLLSGAGVFVLMTTWRRGRSELAQAVAGTALPLDLFLTDVELNRPHRVKGTAVFMTSAADTAPAVLLHHFKHNKVLHEKVIILSIVTETVPSIAADQRVQVTPLTEGFYRVVAHYGFMEKPDVLALMRQVGRQGVKINLADTSFYLGRETLLTTGRSKMPRWRKILFAFLSRNARSATDFFGLPPNRVVELGAQIEL